MTEGEEGSGNLLFCVNLRFSPTMHDIRLVDTELLLLLLVLNRLISAIMKCNQVHATQN